MNNNDNKAKFTKSTQSTYIQSQTETECAPFFISISDLPNAHKRDLINLSLIDPQTNNILLVRERHGKYLKKPLSEKHESTLPGGYISLDSSRPWIMYWVLHGLDLLDDMPCEHMLKGVVHTIESCWSDVGKDRDGNGGGSGGGFGGGPGQIPHCATTYAAVMALCIIAGCDENTYPEAKGLAIDLLQRKRMDLLKWYVTLRFETRDENENTLVCGYRMHHDGEVDVRATYCIFAVASLLNILTEDLKLGAMEHILLCQTYEGGFGGEPGSEAHGGYTFCALSALLILVSDSHSHKNSHGDNVSDNGSLSLASCGVNLTSLEDWLVRRQLGYEGGFNGRSNKLVDACYSFWVGSAIAILDLDRDCIDTSIPSKFDSGIYHGHDSDSDPFHVLRFNSTIDDTDADNNNNNNKSNGGLTYDQDLLQRYILLCGQDTNGGLRDKPSKSRDFYHSCYALSGLSVSQHVLNKGSKGRSNNDNDAEFTKSLYQGESQNILGATHPVYNIRIERVKFMIASFYSSS